MGRIIEMQTHWSGGKFTSEEDAKLKKSKSNTTSDKQNKENKGPIKIVEPPNQVVQKRIFGQPIDTKIHELLQQRQFNNAGINPNQSRTVSVTGGGQAIPGGSVAGGFELEPIDVVGSSKNNFNTLSEQTSWARMWTAVRNTSFTGAKGVSEQTVKDASESEKHFYFEKNGRYFKMDKTILDTMVYELGNSNYSTFVASPNTPITSTVTNSPTANADETSTFSAELSANQFLKPPAGLISIDSTTEGTLGAIKRTTVNFMVHNFYDFENIYLKYFLKPGALLFIDLGWSDSAMYDNRALVEENGGKDMEKMLFGRDGVLDRYPGELEIIMGYVTHYTSKALADGSFECSVEIISKNEILINNQLDEASGVKNKTFSFMGPYLINTLIGELGIELGTIFADIDPNVEKISENDVAAEQDYIESWGRILFGGGHKTTDIPKIGIERGLYWQEIPYIDTKSGVFGRKKRKYSNGKNLYITWGFFEDKFLNNELGLFSDDEMSTLSNSINAKFDTTNSFVPLDANLQKRQYSILDKSSLVFMYPTKWGVLEDKDNDEYSSYSYVQGKYSGLQRQHENLGVCPISELWISLSVIQQAFSEFDSVSAALIDIMDTISAAAFDIFSLKLSTNDNAVTSLSVVDRNFTDMDTQSFNDLFVFKPHSPQSIITDMQLNYTTPQNGLQNLIAIQNTISPMFPNSSNIDMNLALKGLMAFDNTNTFEYLPQSDTGLLKLKSRIQENEISSQNNSRVEVSTGNINSDNVTSALSNIYNVETDDYEDKVSQLEDARDEYVRAAFEDEAEQVTNGYGFNLGGPFSGGKSTTKPIDDESTKKIKGVVDYTYVDSLEEYYGLLAKNKFYFETFDTIIPMELELSIYGISGIAPGDLFKVDYLPYQLRSNIYFQAITVSQTLTASRWTTRIVAVPRVRRKLKSDLVSGDIPIYKINDATNIRLTKKFLLSQGVSRNAAWLFTDFTVLDDPRVNQYNDIFVVKGLVSAESLQDSSIWDNVVMTGENKEGTYNNFTNNLHSWFTDKDEYEKNSEWFPLEVDFAEGVYVYVVVSGFKNLVLPGKANKNLGEWIQKIVWISHHSTKLRMQPSVS